MFDAVYAFAQALQRVNGSSPLRLFNLSCNANQGWAFGSTLYNYLNMVGAKLSSFTTVSGDCLMTSLSPPPC